MKHRPQPPTDAEKYSYFGPRRRWAFIWLFLSSLLVIAGFAFVMLKSPFTWPILVLLVITVPPTLVNLWLRVQTPRLNLHGHLENIGNFEKSPLKNASIDVFLPSAGEDLGTLDNTFEHVAALQWSGKLDVWVLDDADSPDVKWLAERYGFHYIVRENRGWLKKAGNLIHAFGETSGDFILVFDADFAPRPDFLHEALPYMEDESVGAVQTSQYFNVTKQQGWIERFAGTLQELFFRWIQPSRDAHDAAIVAGTNLIYRRAAVVAAGGFAQVPLGEDVHSGVKLNTVGYKTRYVPLVLATGLCPGDFNSISNQQYRWCRSSLLLMFNDSKMFWSAQFNWKQRISFLAALMYYVSSAAGVLTIFLPTALMLWFYPTEIAPTDYLILIPGLVATVFIFPLLARGWNITIFRQVLLNSFCHVLAAWDATRGKVAAWVPSGSAHKSTGTPTKVRNIAIVWVLTVQVILWSGIIHAIFVGVSPVTLIVTVILALFQLWLEIPLLVASLGRQKTIDIPSRDYMISLAVFGD